MKGLISILPGLLLVLMACQKRSIPVITERKTEPPPVSALVYPPGETVAPDTVEGRNIFIARCGRCHALPRPARYSPARWDLILPTMIPRAKLDNEQVIHVRAWVLANAAK